MGQAQLLMTCVIGGNGFIGRAVVKLLLASGQRRVRVVGRTAAPAVPRGVEYVAVGPDSQSHTVAEAIGDADEIIDLAYATIPQTSFKNPVNDILINVPEVVRLLEHASTTKLRKFVWVSSGGTVYGPAPAYPLKEDYPTNPISPYGITKLAIEKYAYMYYKTRQLPIVCVRPSNAFGPEQKPYTGQGFIATAIASILENKSLSIYGKGDTIRDYLHVEDIASGIIQALLHGIPGEVYNIGSGKGLTNLEIIEKLQALAASQGLAVQIDNLEARLFDVSANILDSYKLTKQTGWAQQYSFDQALAETWDWYMRNHNTGAS